LRRPPCCKYPSVGRSDMVPRLKWRLVTRLLGTGLDRRCHWAREFNFKLGDRIVSAPNGSIVFVPRGTAHTFQNVGTEPGVLLVGVTPGGLEMMFAERQGVDPEANRTLTKMHNMEIVGPPLR
jgi:hypothetical protein